jgi:hypothetical protein
MVVINMIIAAKASTLHMPTSTYITSLKYPRINYTLIVSFYPLSGSDHQHALGHSVTLYLV